MGGGQFQVGQIWELRKGRERSGGMVCYGQAQSDQAAATRKTSCQSMIFYALNAREVERYQCGFRQAAHSGVACKRLVRHHDVPVLITGMSLTP